MKKKIVSFSLAVIVMLCAMFSFCGEVYAEDDPSIYMELDDGPYLEIEFDFEYDSRFQTVEFYPDLPGYYIIQVFGGNSLGQNPDASLYYLTVEDCYGNEVARGIDASGHGNGRMLYCWLMTYMYTIDIGFDYDCEYARLSITYAEDFYPHSSNLNFESIQTYTVPGMLLDFTFYRYNEYQAQVVLIRPEVTDYYEFNVSGTETGAVYLIDPSQPGTFNWIPIRADEFWNIILHEDELYYLVVFVYHDYGEEVFLDTDEVVVTVSIQ